jgi:hypothetical protein
VGQFLEIWGKGSSDLENDRTALMATPGLVADP